MTKTVKKVHGPYTRKDNRQHVVIVYSDLSKRTVSYPKYLIEQKLGRELNPKLETIDHIDGNPLNNDLSNLQVISLAEHARLDSRCVVDECREVQVECCYCFTSFKRYYKSLNDSHNKKKAGPFCSRSCQGKYGAEVQNSRQEKLASPEKPDVTYSTKKKQLMKNGKTRISEHSVVLLNG